jgi:hypothetical protein
VAEPPRFSDADRRARLVARHHLDRRATSVEQAVRGVVALHSSDPLTPYLATWARVPDFALADLDRALYDDRTLWRLHAMRRTLFVVPTDDAPLVAAGAARDVAARERAKVEGWLAAEMDARRVSRWLTELEDRVMDALGGAAELRTGQLVDVVPALGTEITLGSGKWSTRSPLSSKLLFLMAMDGRIVRTRPAGTWRSSQYHWAETSRWFGQQLDEVDPAAAQAELARRYLATHGPATLTDLRWWTGWNAGPAGRSLGQIGAVTVRLDDGGEALVLPDDLEVPAAQETAVALLPGLDPTAMGWKERDWYLGAHGDGVFDHNGNAGPTVWVDGRIVGGWAQHPDGEVVYRLLEDVGTQAEELVAEEAAALTEWLDGVPVTSRFPAPLERALRNGTA